MKIKWKPLIISLAIPLAVGGLGALLGGGMDTYQTLNQPPLSPPAWLFAPVWTVLYILMGLASALVSCSGASQPRRERALTVYTWSLVANFVWPLLFFGLEMYLVAFFWLLLLWMLVGRPRRRISRNSARSNTSSPFPKRK